MSNLLRSLGLAIAPLVATLVGSPVAHASTANAYIFGFTPASDSTPTLALNGGSITLLATSTGWYSAAGLHYDWLPNYIAGKSTTGVFYNDFFVFDLGAINTPITSAVLSISNNDPVGFSGSSPSLLSFWDVSTSTSALTSSHSNATTIYADLGAGVTYGSVLVGTFSNNGIVTISLNSAAIAALNLALGQKFAMGGSLVPAPPSGPPPAVPLPPTLPLMLMAAGIPWLVKLAREKHRRSG